LVTVAVVEGGAVAVGTGEATAVETGGAGRLAETAVPIRAEEEEAEAGITTDPPRLRQEETATREHAVARETMIAETREGVDALAAATGDGEE
jgi:hypothetical protein